MSTKWGQPQAPEHHRALLLHNTLGVQGTDLDAVHERTCTPSIAGWKATRGLDCSR